MIILNVQNVLLAKDIFKLYISSKYVTYDSIVSSPLGKRNNLTRTNVRDYIYFAIKYNLVSDDMAKKARDKAIASIDTKSKRSSYNTKKTYEKLFEERENDKKVFTNGHIINNNEFANNEYKQGEQISLL